MVDSVGSNPLGSFGTGFGHGCAFILSQGNILIDETGFITGFSATQQPGLEASGSLASEFAAGGGGWGWSTCCVLCGYVSRGWVCRESG